MDKTVLNPRVGMLATIRNRSAIISSVDPFDSKTEGILHLVRLEYIDQNGEPEDQVIWEKEFSPNLLEPLTLPNINDSYPMKIAEFKAFQRSVRWSAISPFLSISEKHKDYNFPLSPLFGAVQVEDFQLVPLFKALEMPRISLLIADDVGLGKTIEAGLILTELLLKRRIRKVLIISPASLRHQWKQEMKSKFSLNFDIIDRQETISLQKKLGLDSNPWRTYSRIITSYHYLKQPDILERFISSCKQLDGTAQLPWDLLIVDEAHNLTPSNFGEDSDLSKMLQVISPMFEHKLFLTATPHNGYTRCFTGLLEMLDPVRFNQTSEMNNDFKERIKQVVVRRLKREINEKDIKQGKNQRFPNRELKPVPLYFDVIEKALSKVFDEFRKELKTNFYYSQKKEKMVAHFALEIMSKRLLSCPYSFADSWFRFKEGISSFIEVEVSEVQAAHKAIGEDINDDLETEGRMRHASKIIGSWFKPFIGQFSKQIEQIDKVIKLLGLDNLENNPVEDQRWHRLVKLVREYLLDGNEWKDNERLIIFTEYKTTLDYLVRRLRKEFKNEGAIIELYGGMNDDKREFVKNAFNDPDSSVKILVATDTASEGQNLQETARYLLHYDIPWNPSRLEQRNGRLDRHGQSRDVYIFHFTSEEDNDLKFLSKVINKVNTIREDLGAASEVFDTAFQRRFNDLEESDNVFEELEKAIESRKRLLDEANIYNHEQDQELTEIIEIINSEMDLTPESLKDTLEIALSIGSNLPRLENTNQEGKFKLIKPIPPKWRDVVYDNLELSLDSGHSGSLLNLIFDSNRLITSQNGRNVFRSSKDSALIHLGHPIFTNALAMFARERFPNLKSYNSVSRWIAYYGEVPDDCDFIINLTIEEIATNNLRENFHHWVRTIRIPVKNGDFGEVLNHIPSSKLNYTDEVKDENVIRYFKEQWSSLSYDLKDFVKSYQKNLKEEMEIKLLSILNETLSQEKNSFNFRVKEIDKGMKENTIEKIRKERDKIFNELKQLTLFSEDLAIKQEQYKNLDDELSRRKNHYSELLEYVKKEQERIIKFLIPQKYSLKSLQIFPVTVEFVIAKGKI